MTTEEVDDILEGGEIDQRLASLLEKGTGMPSDFWLRAESNYANDLDRLAPQSAGHLNNINDFVRLRGNASAAFKEVHVQLMASEEYFEYAQLLKDADDYILLAELMDETVNFHLDINSKKGTYVAFGPKLAKFLIQKAMQSEAVDASSFSGRPLVLAG